MVPPHSPGAMHKRLIRNTDSRLEKLTVQEKVNLTLRKSSECCLAELSCVEMCPGL